MLRIGTTTIKTYAGLIVNAELELEENRVKYSELLAQNYGQAFENEKFSHKQCYLQNEASQLRNEVKRLNRWLGQIANFAGPSMIHL